MQNMSILKRELEVYEEHLGKLLADFPQGGYVVIKDDKILGVWNDRLDALREGIKTYGNVPFLVKNIKESDGVINFSRDITFVKCHA